MNKVMNAKRAEDKSAWIAKTENEHGLKACLPEAGGHYVRICMDYVSGKVVYKHSLVYKCFGKLIHKDTSHATIAEAKQAAQRRVAIGGKGKEVLPSQTYFRGAQNT